MESLKTLLLFLLLLAGTHIADAQFFNYDNLVQQLDGHMLQVPNRTNVVDANNLQIPLDLDITTDSGAEQCQPSKGPYCFPSHPSPSTEQGACETAEIVCDEGTCQTMVDYRPLEVYKTDFEIVYWNKTSSQPVSSIRPGCQPIPDGANRLNNSQLICEDQLSISLNVSDVTQNYTLRFFMFFERDAGR